MVQAKGSKGVLLLAIESSYKTLPGSPTVYKKPFNKNSLSGKQSLIESNTITGTRNPVEPGRGQIDPGGSQEFPLCARNVGLDLLLMFGAPTTTDVSTAGTLTGATGATTTIGTWTAVADGAFKVAIDGGTAQAVGPIDFSSGVTTMANVASKIQAAVRAVSTGGFTNATVTFNTETSQFVITSGTTGASSSVSQLTAPTSGTNISGTNFMKCTAGTLAGGVALYQHVFKIGDTMPSATMQKGFTDIGKYFTTPGCKIGKWAISMAVGNNELVYTCDIMASTETGGTSALSATPTELPLTKFNNFQCRVLEGGVAASNVRKFDLSVDFGLDGDTFALDGEAARGDISEGMTQVTGSIETLFQDTTQLEKAEQGTESSLQATLTSGNYSLAIDIPEVMFERTSPPIDGPKGLLATLPYRGFYRDNADATAIKITLINDVAEYALPSA